jgi:hypothetical protein
LKRAFWAAGVCGILSASAASACSFRLHSTCLDCEIPAQMIARRGKPCGALGIESGGIPSVGSKVTQLPTLGKAGVGQGGRFAYVSQKTGTDRFTITRYMLERTNRPATVRYNFTVQVID